MTVNTGQPIPPGGELPKKKTSPWLFVLIGCGGLTVLSCIGVGIVAFLAKRAGEELVGDLEDPVKREAKAKTMLGAKKLPEGYYPTFSMGIPMVMDMALLGDVPPGPDGKAGEGAPEKGFMYIAMKIEADEATQKKQRAYFEGDSEEAPDLGQNAQIDIKESLRKGKVTVNGDTVWFSSFRGSVESSSGNKQGSGPQLTTLVFPECADKKIRFGTWFMADPEPSKPLDQMELGGTPLDPDALEPFLGHFKFCP